MESSRDGSGRAEEHPETQYLSLLQRLIDDGDERVDRTGVGTRALFGHQMRFDLSEGFPVFTTKRIFWKTAFAEMLWMLSGSTHIRPLLEQGVRIWSDWPLQRYRLETGQEISQKEFEDRILRDEAFSLAWGDLGPVYGKQWRQWRADDGREIDQVQAVVDLIRTSPTSRRILWEGWNVGELERMALPPCHKTYQFFVRPDEGTLSGAVVQRSADCFLGLPWNVCNLALVTTLLARHTGLQPGEIIWFGLDVHLYLNHLQQARKQLQRTPRPFPRLLIKRATPSIFDYRVDDLDLDEYRPHPPISAPVAV